MTVQIESDANPFATPEVCRLVFEAARRADAMGLVDPDQVTRLDLETVRHVVKGVQRAGIGRLPAAELDNLEVPSRGELESLLRLLIGALEASPVPAFEWRSLARVFEPEQLAPLLGVSVSSLRRYQAGSRHTPDEVAERLHFLALVLGDLAGAYNDIGIRRWFERPRTALGGKRPAALLEGGWDPEDEGARKVRDLARALVSLSAT